jgi:hypothetical protein
MALLSTLKAIAPIAAPIVGGIINRRTAGNATNTLTGGVNNAINTVNAGANTASKTLADLWDEQRKLLEPYRTAGMPSTNALAEGVLPGGDLVKRFGNTEFDLYKDPSYQWRIQQGERAINAGANAGGIRFSGATLKALSGFNQQEGSKEWAAADARFNRDQQNEYDRLMGVSNIGQNATNSEVNAAGTYGSNLSRLQQSTADQIAGLQTDLASAQAAGDVAKANSITDTIDKLTTAAGIAKTAVGAAAPGLSADAAAPSIASIIGTGGGTAVGGGTSLASIMAGEVPSIDASAIGLGAPGSVALAGGSTAAPATGVTGALGLGGGSGLFGLGAATIPVVGGAIAGGVLLAKHYIGAGRKQADKLTGEGGLQNAFEKTLQQIDTSPDFTPQQKWAGKTSAYDELEKRVLAFAKQGKNQRKVASQMFDEISHLFGKPNPLRGAA